MNIQVRASHIIVTTIAALALIAGVGAAGAVAGAKWIDGDDIRKNSIPANRLEKGSVTGKQVKKGTIKGDRIAQRTIAANQLTEGAVEELQPTVEYVDHVFAPTENNQWVAATCPVGTQAVGGYIKPGWSANPNFSEAYIDPAQNAYMVRFDSPGGQTTIQTICLR